MAIRHVVTRGFGNCTFLATNDSGKLSIVTRGYGVGVLTVIAPDTGAALPFPGWTNQKMPGRFVEVLEIPFPEWWVRVEDTRRRLEEVTLALSPMGVAALERVRVVDQVVPAMELFHPRIYDRQPRATEKTSVKIEVPEVDASHRMKIDRKKQLAMLGIEI